MLNLDTTSLGSLYIRRIINESRYYHDRLCPKFWHNGVFDSVVRHKLITIALDFYDHLQLPAPILDIQLTGSLANYNYTSYSDLDVHVIIDFSKINEDKELVKQAVDGMRFVWNARHNIVIKDHDVELYIQDVKEQHTASGLFSLKNNDWIREPKPSTPEIDEQDVKTKYKGYVAEIDKMDELLSRPSLSKDEYQAIETRATKLKEKIQEDRKKGLKQEGEYNVENLVFKELRNSEYIEKLINIASKAYDAMFSDKK